ncbi:MAG: Appr-1-p processing protein, partial [bacterium]
MKIEKIYLIDIHEALASAWRQVFENIDIFVPVQGDFFSVEADAMVSPANSFGIMDGGLDLAIRRKLGFHVQKVIKSVVCPGLGTGVGGLAPRKCAAQMRVAFNYISKSARIPSFNEIHEVHEKLLLA